MFPSDHDSQHSWVKRVGSLQSLGMDRERTGGKKILKKEICPGFTKTIW
ncbi:hypothetical protein D3OALGA1CA_3300 [Olavius algarvensis associated proteobacterium Delta 3]|nr:hypothetical protein D3OALGA1CA_3300 [Olavius algarvensis associated proteobacterium Delta 3]CAB5165037.1 hypothetical protein D3OALGB2SA_5689 [Olavius algarvensis associated proteobacterium Delta 3]